MANSDLDKYYKALDGFVINTSSHTYQQHYMLIACLHISCVSACICGFKVDVAASYLASYTKVFVDASCFFHSSSSFWACTAKRSHQSSEWTILSHINCFIQEEVVGFEILLDSLHPCSMQRPGGLLQFFKLEAVKIFLASGFIWNLL